ncbi:MAG: hypothetical protein JOZ72_19085 [Alphaproteobacteria bacterium]|nr:hypothetical protein [Alphaproteobacteria bacterium]
MRNLSNACRVSVVLLFAVLSSHLPAGAGTMIRQTATIFDTGFQYNTKGRERVGLRIYYEGMQLSDAHWAWQIGYEAVAQHKNLGGQWVNTSKLYDFSYRFKLQFIGPGGIYTSPFIGATVDLDHLEYASGLVYDGATVQSVPIVTQATFTAQRYGGQSGFSVTINR